MAQERGGDGGDGLRRGCWRGSLQSQSPSDSAGRQTGFLIGEHIGLAAHGIISFEPAGAGLALNLGSAKKALISLLSLSTISDGVFLGAASGRRLIEPRSP